MNIMQTIRENAKKQSIIRGERAYQNAMYFAAKLDIVSQAHHIGQQRRYLKVYRYCDRFLLRALKNTSVGF